MTTDIHTTLTAGQFSAYRCIGYSDVFAHPVRKEEIALFMDMSVTDDELTDILEQLVKKKIAGCINGYYFIGDGKEKIKQRLDKEKRFLKNRKVIVTIGKLISRFPYVKSVSVSGSCSKGLLERDGDVDFFVITAPGKLWLCRTLLIMFKKIFLLNSKKYFCVNYLIDERSLEIPDKNLFVANEITTLAPVYNPTLHEAFLKANKWTEEFFPNREQYNASLVSAAKPARLTGRLIETVLNNRFGEKLDNYFFHLTLKVWKKRFAEFDSDDFDLNMRTRKNVSKHHPRGYQKKVLAELDKRLHKIQVSAAAA
jgi:hypothetical protein